MPPRHAPTALLTVAALFLATCGGDDARAPYDPDRAEQIARDAIIDADDIEPERWGLLFERSGIGEEDAFVLPFEARDAPGACGEVAQLARDARASLVEKHGERTAIYETNRVFERPAFGQLDLIANAEAAIAIYDDAGYATDTVESLASVIGGEPFVECLRESFAGQFQQGGGRVQIELQEREATAELPGPGAATAIDLNAFIFDSADVPLVDFSFRIEFYLWADENAILDVVISGERGDIPPELVTGTVERAAAKLAAERE